MSHKRDTPRTPVLVRFEPDLLAKVDAKPGENRHAKIIALIEKGLSR